jgi:hypothetical protein
VSSKKNPGLGAFAAPVKFQVTQGGVTYEFNAPAITLTPAGSEAKRSLSGTGTFLPVGTPGPGPGPGPGPVPAPQVESVTISPNAAAPGSQVQVTVFVGPVVEGSGGVTVALGYDRTILTGALTITVAPGQIRATAALTVTATLPGVVTLTAATGTVMRTATLRITGTTPTPHPQPGPTKNVRDYGVKGDSKTSDVMALNALIRLAAPGDTLYFPAGTYLLPDALKVLRPDLNFQGDGDQSVLKLTGNSYHVQIGSGQPFTGFSFRQLHFYGTPGHYMQDGSSHGGILNFGSKGTVFEDCLFTGAAEPIMDAGSVGGTAGTIINRCRFMGWGRVAVFANGGEQITNCQFIQDDPNLRGERSSHGIYIHGGASNVLVADCEFANIRKYAIQQYSEQVGTKTTGVRLLRLKIRDSANGIIFAHSQMGAGDISDSMIDGCTITGVYAGSSLAIKDGDGVKITNNVIDGNTGAASGHSGSGAYLGVWAPYEPSFSLSNVLVEGNTIKNCDTGIWVLPSNSGKFSNIIIRGNHVSGCRKNYDITGPGVTWTPGAEQEQPQAQSRVADSRVDMRPSDDRSEMAKRLAA